MSALLGLAGSALLDWPTRPWFGPVLGLIALPLAAGLARWDRTAGHGRKVLVVVTVLAGLTMTVVCLYLAVVLALGRAPGGGERNVFALCFGATLVACALVGPVRRRLGRWAAAAVYGDVVEPEAALAAFGSRMTRAVSMDELLLQLAELLHGGLDLSSVEIWTGQGGRLTRIVSVPERGPATIELDAEAHEVAARTPVHGGAWLEMWVPELLAGREAGGVRAIPLRFQGELLGLLVLEGVGLATLDPGVGDKLSDLARQLGLALNNVRLDSALQESIDELEARNAELTASRARIVAVADESRRMIERDIHDGAQPHLVALAVKVGLIRAAVADAPDTVSLLLADLAEDLNSAIDELRELAHGIYPPRLRDRGLADALDAAAGRALRPTTVEAIGIGRYPADVEAAIYFCCLEALQNAVKHGDDETIVHVRITGSSSRVCFVVSDTGPGFDPSSVPTGQGLVNMRDRLGAVGGELTIESQPGSGTTVSGVLPASTVVEPDRDHSVSPR